MDNKRLQEILSHPATSVPICAEILNMSRNGGYNAARRGYIPVIEMGRKLIVPTEWIRQKLMLESGAPKKVEA